MSNISSLTPLYNLAYPSKESIFIKPSLPQSPINYERVAPQGFEGINIDRGLDAYDASYIFQEGTVTPEETLAMFPFSYSPTEGSSQTTHTDFTPPGSAEPTIAADHPGTLCVTTASM
jgi:hypothetical protein